MKKILTTLIISVYSLVGFCQWNYPISKTVDTIDTYWGVSYKDSYRWMENLKDTSVSSWFKKQAEFTNSIMKKVSGRDELIIEWKKLDMLQPDIYFDPVIENKRVFYQKIKPGEKVSKVYYRENIKAKEKLLFDPLNFIKGKVLSVEQIIPSFDAKKLIIAYSENGAEVSMIRIMDVETKQFLPDSIYPADEVNGWAFDNNSFLYVSLETADNREADARLNLKTKMHVLGTKVESDKDFFSNASYPSLKIDSAVYPSAFVNKESPAYVFADLSTVENEYTMYYAPIDQFNSEKIEWKVLCMPSDKLIRKLEMIGNKAYAITYEGAKNYKVVSCDLKNPDWAKAKIIAEEKTTTLEYFTSSKDYLFLVYSDGIYNYLYKYNFKTEKTVEIKLPFRGTIGVSCPDKTTNECLVNIGSWNKPWTQFSYDGNTDNFSSAPLNKPSVFPKEYKDLIVEELEVKGHDGVMIPLSIIYKKGLKKDGSNICFMDGYGAYGESLKPWFKRLESSFALKGVIMAVAHVRGGSEKGEAWYKGGYKTTKPNTWKDFISCAEYLIENKYTSSQKLGATGGSAGGILISRVITERPQLLAAALCNVGVANAMRMEFSLNGPCNIPEFGTVKDSIECKALYEMDGVQHVVKNTSYPAVMCIAGWNDPRVAAWEPGKFAAALQNSSISGKPVLMKVNYDNGHFTEDRDVVYANYADQFSFFLWQCGHPDFQLKKNK